MNALTRSTAQHDQLPSLLVECAFFMRRSRSVASMLPAFLISGMASLVTSLVLHAAGTGGNEHLVTGWVEGWLTAWPIAFPLTYGVALSLRKMTSLLKKRSRPAGGLGFADVVDVSSGVTKAHRLHVLRGLRAGDPYRA
ncbi:DUF2798 domain-containing protein [Noviherbaspirillum sp. Root189]|uniref:DUF2798 domain-containing protein n=1 Tax=Noviherbaspirillum sp. Root189 TaxID=1736487 RepID=UPI00070C542C|nr:DUF2798 domain-containing protein [Noviherbaspirillum sp. Root189]KRB94179.1 hypothetical protein ASE07_01190 [Noviherbaspirillum sp. Root189]